MFDTKKRLICGQFRKKTMLLFSMIFINFNVGVTGELTEVINTTTGSVQGQILYTVWHGKPYASFEGIRYAQPPIGYLRFKPPVPIDPWSDTYQATAPVPACTQTNSESNEVEGTEDCLMLNVYTPKTSFSNVSSNTDTENLATMVWFYGGAFVRGYSADEEFSPDYLIEKNVVVVSMNYRLGAFGFLALNHENATGNAGLKDQRLALKWVQANIEYFGGNRNNVTIFGESAGAVSVGFQTLSEGSAGLFHGVISMSGTPLVPWGFQSPTEAEKRAQRLGSLVGAKSKNASVILKALYNATAREIAKATDKDGIIISFTPTLENPDIATDLFISNCSVDLYKSGNFIKVPQLLGFMAEETITFAPYVSSIYKFINSIVDFLRKIASILPSILGDLVKLVSEGLEAFKYILIYFVVQQTTDLLFITPIDITQQYLANDNGGKSVYYYVNSFYTDRNLHNIEYNTTLKGAGHTDDIAEVFYIPYAHYNLSSNDSIMRTIVEVTTMWTNFAKYGDPTPDWVDEYPLNFTWPVSDKSGLALDIGNKITVVSRPTNLNVEFLEIYNKLFISDVNGCNPLLTL